MAKIDIRIPESFSDNQTVAIEARALKSIGLGSDPDLAEELGKCGDFKPCRVKVGKVRKAMAKSPTPKPTPATDDKPSK